MRFDLENGELKIFRPDGEPFASYVELVSQRDAERQRAEQERQRAEQEHQRAELAEQRARELEERLRALGVEPDAK